MSRIVRFSSSSHNEFAICAGPKRKLKILAAQS